MSRGSELKLLVLTWDQLFSDVLSLADKLDGRALDALVAVARGGLVIARMLSDLLEVKRIAALQLEYYRGVGERAATPRVVGGLNLDVRDQSVLVVDDVADTGETLRLAVEYVRGAGAREVAVCAVYVKPWCRFRPQYYARVVEEWVVFPYEHLETAKHLIAKGWSVEQLLERGFSRAVLERLLGRRATFNS